MDNGVAKGKKIVIGADHNVAMDQRVANDKDADLTMCYKEDPMFTVQKEHLNKEEKPRSHFGSVDSTWKLQKKLTLEEGDLWDSAGGNKVKVMSTRQRKLTWPWAKKTRMLN